MSNPLFSLVSYDNSDDENSSEDVGGAGMEGNKSDATKQNGDPTKVATEPSDGVVKILVSANGQESGTSVKEDQKKRKRRRSCLVEYNHEEEEGKESDSLGSEEFDDDSDDDSKSDAQNDPSKSAADSVVHQQNGQATNFEDKRSQIRARLSELAPFVETDISPEFQEKLDATRVKLHSLYNIVKEGKSLCQSLRQQKGFRNPTIYGRLVESFGISEVGTNMPANLFDISGFQSSDYYKELAASYKAHMEKQRQQPRKIEFTTHSVQIGGNITSVPAVIIEKSTTTNSQSSTTSANKKSKWDLK